MNRRVLTTATSAFALLCLSLLLGGAHAAFFGYDGDTPDIAYDTGAAIGSTGSGVAATGSDPVWSPDATELAYVGAAYVDDADPATGVGPITIRGAANSSTPQPTTATGSEPAWSPDGTKLAYVDTSGEIRVHDVSGGSSDANLTNSAAVDLDPAWSPSGGQIAFARQIGGASGKFALFVMNSDGTGQTQLTSGLVNDRHPAWSPDGFTLAFDSDRDGVKQIYSIPSGGGNATRLTNTTDEDQMPSYAPEGDRIVFSQTGAGLFTIPAGGGSATAVSGAPATAENPDWRIAPPHNTSPPTISGSNQVGSTVFASTGSWTGAKSFTFQWYSCTTSSFSSCSPISGATGQSYTLKSTDQGKGVAVEVVAHNSAGASAPAHSDVYTGISGQGPQIHDLPRIIIGFGSIDNQPTIGFTVSATTGTWQSNLPLTFTYQWRMCERNNGPCTDIDGATSSTLVVPPQAIGRELVIAVTAHNSAGDTYIESNRTTAVTGFVPHPKQTPPVLGTNEVGQTLTVGPGLWTGSAPITFRFDWRRCDAFGTLPSCVSIPGAQTAGLSSTYTLQPADIDYTIRVFITAHNTVGDTTIFTNHTFPTLPKRKLIPAVTISPTIEGVVHPGRLLTASTGSWSGDQPIDFQVFWRRCNAIATQCVTLKNAKMTYKLTRKDLGHTFIIVVNATNAAGTTQAISAPTDTVSLTPLRKKGRRIVGSKRANYLGGSAYDDTIFGNSGNDTIKGGAGNDRIFGGSGDDVIDGGPGSDRIDGGPGSDTITAADGVKDVIDCGPGQDRVIADPDDVLKNCESVSYVTPTTGTTGAPGTNP